MKSKKQRLADRLENMIEKKPWDRYILIDKNLLWAVINHLRR